MMAKKTERCRCFACDAWASMTVTAPDGTVYPCCDDHRKTGWALGYQDVDRIKVTLWQAACPYDSPASR